MKARYAFSTAPLVPLFIVIILATAGITLNAWIYVVLAVVCPLAAGVVWFQYKEMVGKIKNAEKKGDRDRGD